MIYFGHSFYDIQGKKYLKNNFETLEVQILPTLFEISKEETFRNKYPVF